METKSHKLKRGNRRTLKKMNCNPNIEGKTQLKDSCFTPDILMKIKSEFNRHHPENPIHNTDYIDLWKQLKYRLNHCDKEDCWLEQIKDVELKKQIDKMSFAPDKPAEWKKNPRTWLSNFDIMKVLRQYETMPVQGKHKFMPLKNSIRTANLTHQRFKLLGPTPIDFDSRPTNLNGECVWEEICKFDVKTYLDKGKTKIGIVFNLDKHTQGGSHWVSLFVDLEDSFIFYFDSNGDKIKPQIKVLVDRIQKQGEQLEKPIHFEFHENHPREHQKQNTECGMYSLFFIIAMLTNKAGSKKFSNVNDKISYFKTKTLPDNYVFAYRNKYFND
jgi:hypothetical protein